MRATYFSVKGNQGMQEQSFDDYYRMNMFQDFDGSSYSTQVKNCRIEMRVALVDSNLLVLDDIEHEWPKLKTMALLLPFAKSQR